MSESQVTIFIGIAGILTVVLGGVIKYLVGMNGRLSRLEGTSELSWKILELYAGKALHRHEDDFGVDWYIDHQDDLSPDEAQVFINRLAEIADDNNIADGTKIAAAVKMAAIVRRYHQYHLQVPGL